MPHPSYHKSDDRRVERDLLHPGRMLLDTACSLRSGEDDLRGRRLRWCRASAKRGSIPTLSRFDRKDRTEPFDTPWGQARLLLAPISQKSQHL